MLSLSPYLLLLASGLTLRVLGCPLVEYPPPTGTCQSRSGEAGDGAHGDEGQRKPLGYPHGTLGYGPNPREVSNLVANQDDAPQPRLNDETNLLLIFFGQFLDHDLTLTVGADASNGRNQANIPDVGDGMGELPFVRSFTSSPGQMPNLNSAWLNLGNVYGDTEERFEALRARNHRKRPGQMRVTKLWKESYLPLYSEVLRRVDIDDFANELGPSSSGPIQCGRTRRDKFRPQRASCRKGPASFACGDPRCNEHVVLLALTQLFVRNHNRLADLALNVTPRGGLSKKEYSRLIYDTARMTNIYNWQKIVFEEWLPLVIGETGMGLLKPRSAHGGTEATIDILFSTAAFRFGHSALGDEVSQANKRGRITKTARLSELFFNPAQLRSKKKVFGRVLNGLRMTPHEDIDSMFVNSVRSELFGNKGESPTDLFALNVQRGRDHGLAGLNTYAEAWGSTAYDTFMELTGGDAVLSAKLDGLYGKDQVDEGLCWQAPRCGSPSAFSALNSARDGQAKSFESCRNSNTSPSFRLCTSLVSAALSLPADVLVAGLAEKTYGDSQLGELFTRVICDQFSRIRDADSFWYTEANDFLEPLRPMAEIMAINSDAPEELSGETNAFLVPGGTGRRSRSFPTLPPTLPLTLPPTLPPSLAPTLLETTLATIPPGTDATDAPTSDRYDPYAVLFATSGPDIADTSAPILSNVLSPTLAPSPLATSLPTFVAFPDPSTSGPTSPPSTSDPTSPLSTSATAPVAPSTPPSEATSAPFTEDPQISTSEPTPSPTP
ncbi:unnamed protein product [Chrysoparadoxa australica]